jgi:hypothetical protein
MNERPCAEKEYRKIKKEMQAEFVSIQEASRISGIGSQTIRLYKKGH